ncbi:MAG: flagellar hook-length control protein FliK [Eubacterium sp.]|nr:flagellar hook-length control protein FliK [Eubacterium sp.]
MQIADFLGQYANTLANAPLAAPSAKPGGAPAVQSLVSELTQMQEGAVFEGSVNSIDGSRVLLGLGNGQSIAARLEGSVDLMLGQSVFFQVKSNDGQTIAIKPFMGGKAFNPTIQKALDAAGMEMTKDTIDMVNRMMEEGMPIDKQSLAAMRHTLMQNPRVSLDTAVMMTKLGIPVSDQMAAQFENYQNDRHSMLQEMNQVMEGLSEVYAKASGGAKGLLMLNEQILSILDTSGAAAEGTALFLDEAQALQNGKAAGEAQGIGQQPDMQAAAEVGNTSGAAENAQAAQSDAQAAAQPGQAAPEQAAQQAAGSRQEDIAAQKAAGEDAGTPRPIGELLNKHQLAQLEAQLKEAFPKAEQMKLNAQLTAKEFLDVVAKQLEQQPQAFDKAVLGRLFAGKEYHTLLKDVMQEQWTVRPQELKTEHKVEELYQRLNRQMGQIEQLARHTGMNTSQLSQSAAQVRDNLEFMHQINQAYTYVQIPLKMANQNAHSDLYVYTNKRNLGKKEGELSAFLHLELENLGTTDVSIKMLENNVSTKFYLSDDAAYDLLEQHLPKLQERLEKLGYHCTVTIENREEKVDFVEDFLQKSQPAKAASRGMVHRYSFDMRA